jgi:mRNA interferase MazF
VSDIRQDKCIGLISDLRPVQRPRSVIRASRSVVCLLTSNLSRAKAPGNVPLKKGEANLPKASVVNVSQILTVDKAELAECTGKLSAASAKAVRDGLRLISTGCERISSLLRVGIIMKRRDRWRQSQSNPFRSLSGGRKTAAGGIGEMARLFQEVVRKRHLLSFPRRVLEHGLL